MRIAIVAEVFLPKIDGVVHRTVNLIRQLEAAGDEVLVVCPQADGPRRCTTPVVEYRSFPLFAYPEYRIGLPDRSFPETIGRFAPDLIHFINPFAFGFRCHDALQRANSDVPCVFSFHTLYGEFVRKYGLLRPLGGLLWWIMREYHNGADANLTVSTAMQEELVRRGFERVGYWPPAVDSQMFHPAGASEPMRARLSGGRPERPLLLTVSRLAPEKNVGLLARLLERLPEATLAIVGDGPQRAELERLFRPLDARFLGYLRGRELAEAYASADLFVYASETETMGNVVLEAMAAGRPVVAPRAGGIPSLIDPGRTGMLFEPGDVGDAERCVRELLGDAERRKTLGEAARSAVEDRGWKRSVDAVREFYRRTIETVPESRLPRRPRRLARAVVDSLVLAFRSVQAGDPRRVLRRRRPVDSGATDVVRL